MKFDRKKLGDRWIPYAVGGCITVVVYLCLSHLGVFGSGLKKFLGYFSPVFIGLVMAYVMDPLVNVFQKRVFIHVNSQTLRRNLSVIFTIIAVLLFIVILLVALVPQVIESIVTFMGNLDSYVEQLQNLLAALGASSAQSDSKIDLSGLTSSGSSLIGKVTSLIPDNLGNLVDTSVNIGRNAVMLVIDFILAIYFLLDKKNLLNGLKRFLRALLPENAYARGGAFWYRCNGILIRYIACDLLDGLIVGVANCVFMLVARLPYIALISVVVGVTNLAPTFGPIAGAVIGAFILLMVNPWYALWFLIFTIVLQTIDGYVIKPKLFGDSLGVSSVLILVSIVVGGRMFGVVGILLSIPAAAIIDFVYREGFLPWLERRRAGKRKKTELNTGSEEKEE